MKKYKNKIVAGIIVAIVLAFSLLYGGNEIKGSGTKAECENIKVIKCEEKGSVSQDNETEETDVSEKENLIPEEEKLVPEDENITSGNEINPDIQSSKSDNQSVSQIIEKKPVEEINKKSGEDEYMTSPVPDGKPNPVEPEETVISNEEYTCTLSVSCGTILDNIELLDKEKVDIVPENGVIFAEKTVTFYDGESVFNVLLREMKRNKIHIEFVNTPIFNSAYIEGINNLYEFDCGELSGWMYKVNGWFPNDGCSRYQLKDGDRIEWVYTCDLGADIGGNNFEKGD